MNIYFYIIIGIILFEYLLSFIVRTLNLKALDPNLPKEFQDTFDNDKYLKSQEYTKTNSQFSYITSTFSLLVSLVFIFGVPQFGINQLYNEIDLLVRSYGYGSIITGLIFFGSYGDVQEVEVDGSYTVDNGYAVAWEENLDYSIGRSGRSIRSFLFSDQFICRFHGNGKLWVQTRSPRNLAAWVHPFRRVKSKND